MTMDRHEPFEELISASLSGDLNAIERERLDAHLDACAICRTTLAAFAEQRRIMAGLRHLAPPRDLGARVRTGVERGRFADVPWWRRPVVLFAGVGGSLAAVAGALLALVLLNGAPDDPQVGQPSPTQTPTIAAVPSEAVEATPTPVPPPTSAPTAQPSAAPVPTLPPPPDPSAPVETTAPSTDPGASPTATPVPPSPEPDVFVAYTGPVESPALEIVDTPTGDPLAEVAEPVGPPIAAELSPEGGFLAITSRLGESGLNQIAVTRIESDADADGEADGPPPIDSDVERGESLLLAQSLAVGPFVERMTWSPLGHYLAYTVADAEASGATDVFIFEAATGDTWQLTDTGNAYAGSWVLGEDDAPLLWVSSAAKRPVSHLVPVLDADDERRELVDPSEDPVAEAEGVFVPILNPEGRFAIYWAGRMAETDGGWMLAEGGAPYLSVHGARGDTYAFDNERLLFSDLTIDRDAFTSAEISWGLDGITYAVSEVRWTGDSQSNDEDVPYPDPQRVYFGHATDPRGLTQAHAIDATDVPEGSMVVDVKVSPTGHHLVITALRPIGGVLEAPTADLLLVTRNTGNTPDVVESLNADEEGWYGPAAFDAYLEIVPEE
jgi:hypothetical protein